MHVERYQPAARPLWDDFVRRSKNGTFLLLRDYVGYHADRFHDHSLLVRDGDGRLRALLPANADGDRLVSHGGLTYGGLITGPDMKAPVMLEVFEAVAAALAAWGFRELVYKTVPAIYHLFPADEDLYALFLAGARLSRRDLLTVVDPARRLPYQDRRARSVAKARKAGLACAEDGDLPGFWAVVADNLARRHGTAPVHALEEIRRLRERFPESIRLFTCRGGPGGPVLGGVLVYESPRVAHVQYIASTDDGRRLGALDLLFDELLGGPFAGKPYFDFGISNEDGGRKLNRGLIDQKEGFGARAVAHDHYTLALADWRPGRLLEAVA